MLASNNFELASLSIDILMILQQKIASKIKIDIGDNSNQDLSNLEAIDCASRYFDYQLKNFPVVYLYSPNLKIYNSLIKRKICLDCSFCLLNSIKSQTQKKHLNHFPKIQTKLLKKIWCLFATQFRVPKKPDPTLLFPFFSSFSTLRSF